MNHVETKNFISCLSIESEMADRIQNFDWSKTALGPLESWSLSLKNAVTLMLSSGHPMYLAWGDEHIQIYNDAYRPILGHSGRHPSALGQSARECWPEAWTELQLRWNSVKSTGKNYTGENVRYVLRRNGHFEEAFFSLSIAPLRNDKLDIEGIFITCFETTDKIRQDLKLKNDIMRFQHQLHEYQQKLSIRDEFMSIASHDLKSPLTALKLQTQSQKQLVLKKDPRGFDKDRIRTFSEVVDDQVGRLNKMVDDMLEIGRIRRGKITIQKCPVELGRLVRDSIESVRSQFTAKNFPLVETQGLVKGNWDEEKIRKVVANLLINSVKFGGDSPIQVKVSMDKDFAQLVIKDRGPGIPEQYLENIFDRYERVAPKNQPEEKHGLFLTKQMVELHNGKISVESSQSGTTFFVSLPL